MAKDLQVVKKPTYNDIEAFLLKAGKSLTTFRYFNSRDISIIDNHICTLLYVTDEPIGYGHLEEENGIVWLGICVTDKMRGKGVGSVIMNDLLTYAKEREIPEIHLTVDIDNSHAIFLYEKLRFEKLEINESSLHMVLKFIEKL